MPKVKDQLIHASGIRGGWPIRACRELMALTGLALASAALQSCSEPVTPDWIVLTDQLQLGSWTFPTAVAPTGAKSMVGFENADPTRYTRLLRREDWQPYPLPGTWQIKLGVNLTRPLNNRVSPFRLQSADQTFSPRGTPASGNNHQKLFPVNSFAVADDSILIRLGKDQVPPTELLFSMLKPGPDTEDLGHIRGKRFSGRGLPLWTGSTYSISLIVPRNSTLRFATAADLFLADSADRDPPTAEQPVSFNVSVNGKPSFEHQEVLPASDPYRWHSMELPAAGGRIQLQFEVSGPPAYCTFFSPTIGPHDIGTRGNRPWGTTRPDVILFLADTFRADNLSIYGSAEPTIPALDALVSEALCFTRAWSPSTYTIPSHTSLFSGVYPRQAGIGSFESSMPTELTSLAEHLAAHGYRTGAITDGGGVSKDFSFEQGFEWFDEKHYTVENTLERAQNFLDADDGRPTFLFVQSYRAHTPYRPEVLTSVSPEAIAAILREFRELEDELLDLAHSEGFKNTRDAYSLPDQLGFHPQAKGTLVELERKYRLGSKGMGDQFVGFQAALREDGFLKNGLLVFTSDHGEAFGEHGEVFHGNRVFEEETRIPLLFFSDLITAGKVDYGASLLDLPPTIAAMAGLPQLDNWEGTSLLSLAEDRPILAFECNASRLSTFSIIDGDRKIIAYEEENSVTDSKLHGVYNLHSDPHERAPENASSQSDSMERLKQLTPWLNACLEPIVGASEASITPEKAAELGALGYTE